MKGPGNRSGRGALALLLLVACGEPPSGDAPPNERAQNDFESATDAFVTAVIQKYEVPGLALSVVRDDQVVYARGFGVERLGASEPITSRHLFHFASVSKPFVATAVMQLVEEGRMELDAPVADYLPYFQLADPRAGEITIRQMLDHTSGIPDVDDYEWARPQTDEGAAERYARELRTERLIGPPGGQWQYSNRAFDTLADVIARVSGQLFEDYMTERILDPLGMVESTFFYPESNPELRVSGHLPGVPPRVSGVYPYNRRHAPSSTLNSSADEMSRWVRANLRKGELEGARILDSASYEELWARSVQVREDVYVGLSWFVRDHGGATMISHGGGDTGFRSYIVLLPEIDAGFAVASNYSGTPMDLLRDGLSDLLLGNSPEPVLRPISLVFGEALARGGLEAARRAYRAAERSPDDYLFDPRQLQSVAWVLYDDNPLLAIEVLRFNAERYPDSVSSHDSLAYVYLDQGSTDLAIESYRRVLEIDPDNGEARRALAKLAE
jgi:CubicO group peptidase (beta-lactamase class C family)